MNGPYPEITNISFLAKLFFKTFISLKHLSDYRTVVLSDRRTIGLSDCRIIATAPYEIHVNNQNKCNTQIHMNIFCSLDLVTHEISLVEKPEVLKSQYCSLD